MIFLLLLILPVVLNDLVDGDPGREEDELALPRQVVPVVHQVRLQLVGHLYPHLDLRERE